ncbi:LuxR C-terminal-related transcriptional regulator [Streptomyces sp. 7N604]|uniref:LuxR C-terminal-related transcriptional regulator n=1 Tax=Streptomyces sp. 7N604 TaxID=3457415 RepID=UPI003FD37D5C
MAQTGEAVEIRAALLNLRRTSGLPIAFGGLLEDNRQLRIGELSGTRTSALRGLVVATGNGIGGKSLALTRPVAVADYRASRAISHEYDAAVAMEGLGAVLAVPVVVRRRVRGVLYGALPESLSLGDRTLSAAVEAARELEQALAVRDEAQRLLATHPPAAGDPGRPLGPAAWEEVREAHSALRALAPRVTDPALREEIHAVCRRLAAAAGTDARPRTRADDDRAPGRAFGVRLAPRELDVLSCIAAGATNAGAAARLGLRPETVKGYLRSAMRKLGAHTRLEAVVTARRIGLMP